jgi:cobalt transporter subunit CbtB
MAHPLAAMSFAGARPRAMARLLACACAALLGLVLLYGVGLSQPQVVHDAAHDARHAMGFPCH